MGGPPEAVHPDSPRFECDVVVGQPCLEIFEAPDGEVRIQRAQPVGDERGPRRRQFPAVAHGKFWGGRSGDG